MGVKRAMLPLFMKKMMTAKSSPMDFLHLAPPRACVWIRCCDLRTYATLLYHFSTTVNFVQYSHHLWMEVLKLFLFVEKRTNDKKTFDNVSHYLAFQIAISMLIFRFKRNASVTNFMLYVNYNRSQTKCFSHERNCRNNEKYRNITFK